MLNDFLKDKGEEDNAKLHKSRYNFVFFYLIELCIGYCCNLTDHIRLPIIHSKTYIHNRDKREEKVDRITDYISMRVSIQYRELDRVLI